MDVKVFHAGTKAFDNGEIVTNGGHVWLRDGTGDDILDAPNYSLNGLALQLMVCNIAVISVGAIQSSANNQ